MRLLYFTRTYTAHDARWLRVLAARGLTVGFLSLQKITDGGFARTHPQVEALGSPGLADDATTTQLELAEEGLRRRAEHWRADVVLAGPLTDAGYLATRLWPERTLLMCWAFEVLDEPHRSPEAAERLIATLRAGQALFTDGPALLRQCERLAGRSFAESCVLPWGLAPEDRPAPRGGWRRRLGDETARVVLNTRGFAAVHQPLVMLEAFRRAHMQEPGLRLWLAGGGSLQREVEVFVQKARLNGAVRLLGRLDQAALAGCFQEADLYLACSRSDGASVSLLQAMHAGLPCVATDLPGNREWIDAPGNRLVPVDDIAGYAEAILATARLDADLRSENAARHRREIQTRADLAANLPRLLTTLGAVAAGAARREPAEPVLCP